MGASSLIARKSPNSIVRFQTRLGGTLLPLLFLVVGVIAPTTCVLWFMRDAARAQADAAKQSVAEAYRGQLRFMRDKADAYWQARATALQRSAGKGEAADFARNVRAGLADSFIFANYPAPVAVLTADPARTRKESATRPPSPIHPWQPAQRKRRYAC